MNVIPRIVIPKNETSRSEQVEDDDYNDVHSNTPTNSASVTSNGSSTGTKTQESQKINDQDTRSDAGRSGSSFFRDNLGKVVVIVLIVVIVLVLLFWLLTKSDKNKAWNASRPPDVNKIKIVPSDTTSATDSVSGGTANTSVKNSMNHSELVKTISDSELDDIAKMIKASSSSGSGSTASSTGSTADDSRTGSTAQSKSPTLPSIEEVDEHESPIASTKQVSAPKKPEETQSDYVERRLTETMNDRIDNFIKAETEEHSITIRDITGASSRQEPAPVMTTSAEQDAGDVGSDEHSDGVSDDEMVGGFPIRQYKRNTVVRSFESRDELEDAGFNYKKVVKCCKGLSKTYKDYSWKYSN